MHDLILEKMNPGYLVDFDLHTWTVTARHRYGYDGAQEEEWELRCGER